MGKTSIVAKGIDIEQGLSPIEWHALRLASSKRAEDLRDVLTIGSQDVDLTVRVFGSVDVEADHEFDKAESLKAVDLLALVLTLVSERMRGEIIKRLVAVRTGREMQEIPADVAILAKTTIAAATVRKPTKERGAVTAALVLDLVGRDERPFRSSPERQGMDRPSGAGQPLPTKSVGKIGSAGSSGKRAGAARASS